MRRLLLSTAALLAFAGLQSQAFGHAMMMEPTPRSQDDGLKTGPCGNVPPGEANQFEPGETITVSWLETIDHPGWYRLAWSQPGDQDFEDNILLDDIPDVECSAPPCAYSAEITLPDEECQGCALQLIQYMTENPANPRPYFSCADMNLGAGGPSPQDDPADDQGDDEQGDTTPAGDDSSNDGEAPYDGPYAGGCSTGGSNASWLSLLALGLFWSRRRRRN